MTRTRITTDGIAASAVTTAKIADGAVATADIADTAVTTAKIADGSITDAKITSSGLATSSLNWSAIQPWAANTSYAKGALVEFQGIAYRRSAAGTSGASFNSANWQQITPTTIPNTMVTGLGTMSTATAADYLARAGGTMTGQLVALAGNAGAPGVAVGTATNGVLLPQTNSIAIATNGIERWRMGSDGSLSTTAVGDSQNTLRPAGHVRAWARWNGTLTGTNAAVRSFNVTSVTRVSTGLYTVNLTNALSSGSGVAVASAVSSDTLTDLGQFNNMAVAVVVNSTTVRVASVDASNQFQDNAFMSVIVCDL